jgi:hypothetical protein
VSARGDVRRMLLRRGWTEGEYAVLRKRAATWAGWSHGDSALSGPGRSRPGRQRSQWTVDFGADVPAAVIAAMAEAAAAPDGEMTDG